MGVPMFALVATAGVFRVTNAVDALVIGDSYGSYGQSYWGTYCGITVLNEAEGGSTSVQWAAGTKMSDALASAPEAKHILYTIGGNDFMGEPAKCSPTRAELKATVLQSLQILADLVTQAGSGQKITMLGYPVPTESFPTAEGECPGASPSLMDNLNGGIQDACAAVGATYIEQRFVAGATQSPLSWSPLASATGSLHADQVHLNEQGYCKVAISDAYRTRFECSVKKEDQSCNGSGTGSGGGGSTAGLAGGVADAGSRAELAVAAMAAVAGALMVV